MKAGPYSRQQIAKAFGATPRATRREQGVSQDALSEACDFDRTYPSLLERGLRHPTLAMLLRLSDALRLEPERLISETVTRLRLGAHAHMSLPITATLLCLIICSGCDKAPSREFTARFDVQPSPDGRTVVWYLRFSEEQYHAMLEFTRNGDETERVRELIAAGLRMHHLTGCEPHEQAVTRLKDGDIAFVGHCSPTAQKGLAAAIRLRS